MNKELPIYEYKDEIISAIEDNDTVILTAETGSGKSTQVPQYLYEAGYDVIVTQPRRIACITLADRVVEEMGDENVVGYHTAFESTKTPDTKILFCTDGLQMAKGIKDVSNTILVLDEVHEWNLNIETLVAWIKQYRQCGHRLKVVLMSATIELEGLANFYGDAKCISIPGRNYDVQIIENAHDDMVCRVLEYAACGKNVLAFVEGKKEIDNLIEDIKDDGKELDLEILPLYGELSSAEQRKCFMHYPRSKVIVATNIAQTSVTIPDIDVVIDNGKEKRIEVIDGVEGLFIRDISKSDCLQRAGRAGRTKDGIYVLCSYNGLGERDEFSVPEIQRLTLDKVVLKLMSVGIDPIALQFFHQPDKESIISSIKTLNLLGAIKDDKITEVGKRMIKMPVSVRSAKMIIEAEKIGCVDTIIKAVSIIEMGSLINYNAKNEYGDKYKYYNFTFESKSDILAEIDIYNSCINRISRDKLSNGINKKTFFRVKEMIDKLKSVLDVNFDWDRDVSKFDIISCIIAGIPDQIFKSYGYDYYDTNKKSYKLTLNTCLHAPQFVFGFPKTINYTDKWGFKRTIDIITMPTEVSAYELENIMPDWIEESYDESDVSYDKFSKSIVILFRKSYMGIIIDTKYKFLKERDLLYHKFKHLIKTDDQKEQNKNKFVIGDNVYLLHYDSWMYKYGILFVSWQDVLKSDITTLCDADSHPIEFRCDEFKNLNLGIIRERIKQRFIETGVKKAMEEVPKINTGSPRVIIEKMISHIGELSFDIKDIDMRVCKYIGLEEVGNTVKLSVFNDKDEAEKSVTIALRGVISNWIKQQYPDKKFITKINGKKVETKACVKAKEEFHEYCQEIINDTTKDNFEENINFLEEVFNECIGEIA